MHSTCQMKSQNTAIGTKVTNQTRHKTITSKPFDITDLTETVYHARNIQNDGL